MISGFAHFDGAHRENFAAGLILLCIETSSDFKIAFGRLVRHTVGLPEAGVLIEFGREEALAGPDEKKRRSDLWLRYADGVILVELKTHSNWPLSGVVAQMRDQRTSCIGKEQVRDAILLAPGSLLRQLSDAEFSRISWHELFDLVDDVEHPGEVVRLARQHWSEHVEKDFGLPASSQMLPLAATTAQTGCLVAFLRAAFLRLDGKVHDDTVWFSSPDGRPKRVNQWAWIGLAVRGDLPKIGASYIGVYTYSAGPTDGILGTFLEAYRIGNNDQPIVSVPFEPVDLSPESLNAILAGFVEKCSVATGGAEA